MRILVTDCSKQLTPRLFCPEYSGPTATFDAEEKDVLYSPDHRFAVIKLHYGTLFLGIRVTDAGNDSLAGKYVDCCSCSSDEPMLTKLWVDWGCIGYGFCKLVLWAPEKANEFGGSFERTLHRFYFDRDLYERKKNELHGTQL